MASFAPVRSLANGIKGAHADIVKPAMKNAARVAYCWRTRREREEAVMVKTVEANASRSNAPYASTGLLRWSLGYTGFYASSSWGIMNRGQYPPNYVADTVPRWPQ